MPVQGTFTLIQPVSGPTGAEPARPMTSKQVRKAYKEATRAPRLSRAERIKQEKAEQERIRKEFEREKAAARARAAREKKQGKELAERELKRKRGLPLVSVRPSQDTIARFVRGNGTGRKRDAAGQQTTEDAASVALPPGEHAREGPPGHGGGRGEDLDLIPEEDELEEEMMEQLDTITTHQDYQNMKPPNDEPETAADECRPRGPAGRGTTYELDLGLRTSTPQAASSPQAALLQKTKVAAPSGHGHPAEPASPPPRQAPPLSTQAILHNFDDFFPSSSQQERELQDEKAADSPAACAKQQHPPRPDPTTSPLSKRFFTSSGSRELMSLALQRSRRSAALEEIHQKERLQLDAAQPSKPGAAARRARRLQWTTGMAPLPPPPPPPPPAKEEAAKAGDANKENVAPPPPDGLGVAPSASQETEYGGEWVDEIALELAL